MSIKTHWRHLAAAGACALLASQASAHSIAAVTNSANFTFGGAAQIALPGMTTPFFFNPVNARFTVTFSAECAVNAAAGNSGAWTDVDIVVQNAAGVVVATLAPTAGSLDAFCSSNGTAGFDGWASNSITAVGGTNLAAGNYRVQVRARLNAGATGGWFGERSLIVNR